jgi:predicted enzyme related to lactoylglutathione lyase
MQLSQARVAPTIPASDMDRAKRFYGDTLGLKSTMENPAGVMYECGGGTGIFVYPTDQAGANPATYLSFDVDDLEATMADLKAKGIAIESYEGLTDANGIADFGEGGRGFWIKDSEGNILSVGEFPQPS